MSQRGSHRTPVQTIVHRRWWTSIRNSIAFSLLLIFGITLTLLAQNNIEPSKPMLQVNLRVDGSERDVLLRGNTVADLLAHERIVLNKHDEVYPQANTPLEDGMTVKVVRKTFEIIDEKVAIPPPVVTRWDRRMTVKPVVLSAGKPGVAVQKRCIWKKDGVISEQWTQSRRVVTKPVPTIIKRGRIPSRGERIIRVVATAYDPGPASCGRYATGRTAIGMKATKGIIAVDPRVIPLGTRVYVEGYGPAVAGDVGGAIKGNRIDVCFPTRREALQWGRRTVTVRIYQ